MTVVQAADGHELREQVKGEYTSDDQNVPDEHEAYPVSFTVAEHQYCCPW